MRLKVFVAFLLLLPLLSFSQNNIKPTDLSVVKSKIHVGSKVINVYDVLQNNGKEGYVGYQGQLFNVIVHNKIKVPLTLHWHGLIDPYKDDGVPYVTQLPLMPGKSEHIEFPLVQAGTYWMHSHYKAQEAELMAAPFVIRDRKKSGKAKNVTVMLEDFTFKSPKAVLKGLQTQPKVIKIEKPARGKSALDLYDVKSDLLLANRRTLNNPEVIRVTPGEKIRLRLINGAVANNFHIYLPKEVIGKLIAIDGERIHKYYGYDFQIGVANRLDIMLSIPHKKGVYPVFFQAEGRKIRSGIILATAGVAVPTFAVYAKIKSPGFTYMQDFNTHAMNSIARRVVTRTLVYHLTGDMMKYKWGINNQYWPKVTPEFIKQGDHVKLVIINNTGMSHPMHFHGHVFQLVSIDGVPVDGHKGDTILVLPKSRISLIFNANNPGIWAFHCHLLYHQSVGMMTTINYVNVKAPAFYLKKIGMTRQQYLALEKLQINKKIEGR